MQTSNIRSKLAKSQGPHQKPFRILILNAKGGCGKTTIATNLACQFANENHKTVLIDYDPQASASEWLSVRPNNLPFIHCVSAGSKAASMTRTWQLRVPPGTSRVILDTPARLDAMTTTKLVREADSILIPVMDSPIDVRAATRFLTDLMKYPEFRHAKHKAVVLGNRVRHNSLSYDALKAQLEEMGIPFLTSLRESEHYAHAAAEGLGIQELSSKDADPDKDSWQKLARLIEQNDTTPAA